MKIDGIFGAVIVALVLWAAYALATRKFSWSLSGATVPGVLKPSWSAATVFIGGGLAVWAFLAQPRPADVGSTSWDYWLTLLIIWGTLSALVALNATALGAASKVLQTVLAAAVLAVLVGIPSWYGVRDAFLPTKVCPDASEYEVRSCLLNTAWSAWIKAAEGPAVDGMFLWKSDGVDEEHMTRNGTTWFRYRAMEGEIVMKYRLSHTKPTF